MYSFFFNSTSWIKKRLEKGSWGSGRLFPSPAKPLLGVLFLTSPFKVSPASFPKFFLKESCWCGWCHRAALWASARPVFIPKHGQTRAAAALDLSDRNSLLWEEWCHEGDTHTVQFHCDKKRKKNVGFFSYSNGWGQFGPFFSGVTAACRCVFLHVCECVCVCVSEKTDYENLWTTEWHNSQHCAPPPPLGVPS